MNYAQIIQYLTGQLGPDESLEVETWINQSDENHQTFLEFEKLYHIHLPVAKKYNAEIALDKVSARIRQLESNDQLHVVTPEKHAELVDVVADSGYGNKFKSERLHAQIGKYRKNSSLWMKFAASVLLVITVIGLYSYSITSQNVVEIVEPVSGRMIVTNPGEQLTVRLADGTRIMINSGSEIYIPADFGSLERSVSIKGEAFFEVSSSELPFIVRNETSEIKVLGTSFSVRSWPDRNESVVAVQSGLVEVRSANPEITKTVQLSKGQYAIVQSNSSPELYRSGDIGQYVGWTTNEMIFTNTPLRDVITRLELQYNVRITISDSSVLGDPVTARYKNESLDEILKFTTITHGIEFKVTTNR